MNKRHKELDVPKQTWMILVFIIIAAVTIFTFTMLAKSPTSVGAYPLDVASGEAVAVSETRAVIAQSALDGEGTISGETCSLLDEIAKKLKQNAKWFSSCEYISRGSIPDNDTESIIKLSDGDYCATFTFDKNISELLDYKFTDGGCGDSRITIE